MQAIALEHCRHNIIDWVNDWVWTYDPRVKPSMLPFLLFPKQEEYLLWRLERRSLKEHGLIEKSRDMGLTWLNICSQLHSWLFEDGYKGAFGSRKELLVDKLGDPDSIFEKMRILLRYLPTWMLPTGFDWGSHDNFCRLINPATGGALTGESGPNLGRGGRSTVYDLDEAAFIDQPQKVDAAISQNTEVIFYTSTPNGPGNPFAQKRSSGAIAVFRIHWRDDPRKDQAWYEKQRATLDPVIVAQEIDIDYNASIEGVCIPATWVAAAVGLQLEASGRAIAGLDIADEGADKNVLIVRRGPVVVSVDDWGQGGTSETAYKAKEKAIARGVDSLNYDRQGVGAGVAGTFRLIEDMPFTTLPILGGDTPTDRNWKEFGNKPSKEIFKNLRAETWWLLRRRFEKTYEFVNGIAEYPQEELISIPNHQQLIADLSKPLRKYNDRGLILIESKDDMRRRGVKSPDFADALSYAFSPLTAPSKLEARVAPARPASNTARGAIARARMGGKR